MSNGGTSQSMKSVSLKFGQGNSDLATATPATDREDPPSPHAIPETNRGRQNDGGQAAIPPNSGTPEDFPGLRDSSNQPASVQGNRLPPPLPGVSLPESPAPLKNGDKPSLPPGSHLQILAEIIQLARREGISDLQLQPEKLVYANGGGSTRPYEQWGKLTVDAVSEILELLYRQRTIYQGFESEEGKSGDLWHRLITERKVDFACEGLDPAGPLGSGRFRVQGHFSHQGVGITIRVLRNEIALLEQVGLPAEVVESLRQRVTKKQGLGLVVGPTGSGKTTTLAALIDWVRRQHHKHIVTIEDPIEYCYTDTIEVPGGLRPAPALVTQQEVGAHVRSFEQGLVDALRKKPDIILVGEIRTAETLRIALEAAETGHFILSTLHTRGAGKTLGRMRQMFSLEQARGILQQFADVGSFILSQGLMPDVNKRYVLCCEYFAIQEIEDRNAIRKYAEGGFQDVEERLNKPYNRKWNAELKALLNAKRITPEVYEQFYQVTGLENK
jgi:twitching motility protein PilT